MSEQVIVKKTQLQQVTEFLLTSLNAVITRNNIDAWQEHGTLKLNGQDKGQDGYLVAKWKHSAVIAIEKFPHRKVNRYNLLALVSAFLLDSEWQRDELDLADPELNIDVISEDNATILIELELVDDIELVPHPQGPVQFNEQKYYVSLAPIEVAESVSVSVTGDA